VEALSQAHMFCAVVVNVTDGQIIHDIRVIPLGGLSWARAHVLSAFFCNTAWKITNK